ncbi:ThuA domain-containing protein [Fodinibius salsisoli]|uniref:ThuA domain-containing protein n=1 Tax=Fodinibius salsisoli TaxID=2820877 RepID=A0ABT3PI03_9BACT|nr:ThuA domain-containing protein [Fodinibius salsisoli]MCW9705559.1 ThuA domain-containing protein [Fodinibius salsisoli]
MATAPSANSQDSPIKALLITGGGWHDYEAQEKLLTEGIKKRLGSQIEWTVIHEGEGSPAHKVSIFEQANWADQYDVVVHNTGFARMRDGDFLARFVEEHRGTPAVLVHAAIQSYRYAQPADPWFTFMGYQSMVSEDESRPEIENMAPDHPIMKGLPKTFAIPEDEVFIAEKIWGDITLLARAYGEETGTYQPVTWTHEVDSTQTRVFATTLGHHNEIYRQEEFLNMVSNGILWAVERL